MLRRRGVNCNLGADAPLAYNAASSKLSATAQTAFVNSTKFDRGRHFIYYTWWHIEHGKARKREKNHHPCLKEQVSGTATTTVPRLAQLCTTAKLENLDNGCAWRRFREGYPMSQIYNSTAVVQAHKAFQTPAPGAPQSRVLLSLQLSEAHSPPPPLPLP